jgi:hypothetical protein
MAERLLLNPEEQESKNVYKRLCTVPVIQDGRSETIPTLIAPALVPEGNGCIKTIPFISRREGLPSLYPYNGIGIYDRERFIRLGGFDGSLTSFYWQLMDFGFRARLWGEEIAGTQLVKLSYEGVIPAEDGTAGENYRRFYLKNLAPVFRGDYAHIPLRRFPGYLKRSGSDLFAAWEEFSAVRNWVKTNRYRFLSGARTAAELWDDLAELNGGGPENAEDTGEAGGERGEP